jgi:hypothetical protein
MMQMVKTGVAALREKGSLQEALEFHVATRRRDGKQVSHPCFQGMDILQPKLGIQP